MSPATLLFLLLPPLMWASNAVVGRLSVSGGEPLVSPFLLNGLRWAMTLLLLALVAVMLRGPGPVDAAGRQAGAGDGQASGPGASGLAAAWRRDWRAYLVLGLLSVTAYNSLQYLALRSTTAINVTLIGSSAPLWMLVLGRVLWGERGHGRAWLGAAVSFGGVLVVLTGGDPQRLLALRLSPGDLLMLGATVSWSLYSWLLRRIRPAASALSFLILQTAAGLVLSVPVVGAEWGAGGLGLTWGWPTLAVVLWVALGPSLLAYWCWDRGIARAGALLPIFFANLTPLFAALMSAALLGEPPRWHHGLAFVLIAGGIALAQRPARS